MLVTLGLLALLSIKKSTQMTSVQLMLHTYCRNKTQVLENLGFYSNRATSPDVLHWVCNFFLEKGWEVPKPYTLSILYLLRAEIQLAWHLSKGVSHKTLPLPANHFRIWKATLGSPWAVEGCACDQCPLDGIHGPARHRYCCPPITPVLS